MPANPYIFNTTETLGNLTLGKDNKVTPCSLRLPKGSHKSFQMIKFFLMIRTDTLLFISLHVQFIIDTV